MGDSKPVPAWRNYAGLILIVFALSIPVIAALSGKLESSDIPAYVGRALGSLAGLWFVYWLATRNGSELAKANGKAAVGAVLCSVVFSTVSSVQREQAEAKALVQQALLLQQRQAEKFEDLNQRFAKVSFETTLIPENIVTESGIAAGRASVAQYRALVAERGSLLRSAVAESEAYISRIPSEHAQRIAREKMNDGLRPAQSIYGALDEAQVKSADAIDAILTWAASQKGLLKVKNGQLLFTTVEQRNELTQLAAALSLSEEAEIKAGKAANEYAAATAARMTQLRDEANTYLAK